MLNDIYLKIKDYINTCIGEINTQYNVEDTNIKIEIVSETGEWTGIRLSRLPSERVLRTFINGTTEKEFNLELLSKQAVKDFDSGKIAYADYLDILGDKLRSKFRTTKPIVDGVKFKSIDIRVSSVLQFTDGKISAYSLDVKFIYEEF